MNPVRSCTGAVIALQIFFFFVTCARAQDVHTPTYFGIFFDGRDGLVEFVEQVAARVQARGQQEVVVSTVAGWNAIKVYYTNESSIVIYGDEYVPSGVHLYKASSVIDSQTVTRNYSFSALRLRVGPFPGVQGKCYKLTPEAPFEETDYLVEYNNKWFGLSLMRERELKPIKDDLADLCFTDAGTIVAAARGGLYFFDGNWTFKPLRGKVPDRVVPALDKHGSVYFWDENADTALTLATLSGEQIVLKDVSLPGEIGYSWILTYHPRKIRDLIVDPKNMNKFYVVGEGFRAGPEFISGYVAIFGEKGREYNLGSQKLDPAYCAMIDPVNSNFVVVGTTKNVWATTNAGEDWDEIPNWPTNVRRIATAPDKPGTVCFANDGLLTYDSDGKRWVSSQWTYGNVTSFHWDTKSLLASTESKGVFESVDGGKTWKELNSGLMSRRVRRVAADPNNPEILYAATQSGLFKSTNRGTNWAQE